MNQELNFDFSLLLGKDYKPTIQSTLPYTKECFILGNHFDDIKDSEYMEEIKNNWKEYTQGFNKEETENLSILLEQLKLYFDFTNIYYLENELKNIAENILFSKVFPNKDPQETLKTELLNVAKYMYADDDLEFSEYNNNEFISALVRVGFDENDETIQKIMEMQDEEKNTAYFKYLANKMIKIINNG